MVSPLGTLEALDFLFFAIGPPRVGEAGRESVLPRLPVDDALDWYEAWLLLCIFDKSPLDGDMRKDPLVVGGRRTLFSILAWGRDGIGGSGIAGCCAAT
jgi:hypothetical protein